MKYNKISFLIGAESQLLQDACDVLAAMLGDCGFETFEYTGGGMTGYVQQQMFDEDAMEEIIAGFPFDGVSVEYTVEEAEDKDWNEQWENEGFAPVSVGGCIIHDGRHLPTENSEVMVEIDAKLAFGTGNHETTRMIIDQLMHTPLSGKRILDCGTGTGILGILAMKRGAKSVTAYDIDEWSADNARHNAVINGILDNYDVMLGDSSVLDGVNQAFDLIIANINRNILLADMPRWTALLSDNGQLLMSGFYHSDTAILKEKAAALGLAAADEVTDGEWACLSLRRL